MSESVRTTDDLKLLLSRRNSGVRVSMLDEVGKFVGARCVEEKLVYEHRGVIYEKRLNVQADPELKKLWIASATAVDGTVSGP